MRRLLAVALLALALAPAALAGGTQVAVVAAHGRVWALNGAAVVELDRASGRVVRETRGRYPYAEWLVLGRDALWLSSVENGFVSGAVTRVPLAPGRATSPLVLPTQPVYSLATDGRAAWALVGPWKHTRVVRVDARGARSFPAHGVGFLTNGAGVVYGLDRHGGLFRFDGGRATLLARIADADGPPVVGLGSLWVPRGSSLVRLDLSGRRLGSIALGGSPDTVAFDGDEAWAVVLHRDAFRLERLDPARMRVVASRPIPVRGPTLAYGDGTLWLADGNLRVWTVNPRTLALRLFATLPG